MTDSTQKDITCTNATESGIELIRRCLILMAWSVSEGSAHDDHAQRQYLAIQRNELLDGGACEAQIEVYLCIHTFEAFL